MSGTPPTGRSYHSMVVIEKKMFMFGGYNGSARSNEIYVLEEGPRVLVCVSPPARY